MIESGVDAGQGRRRAKRPRSPLSGWQEAAKAVERELLKLEVFDVCGADLAREAAHNYRTLRAHGHTVRKKIDCLIATFCIRAQHSLIHRDRDFDPFEKFLELSIIHA